MVRPGVRKGTELVWEPSALCPPPIQVVVKQVQRNGTRIYAKCTQEGKEWYRHFSLPLPPTMRFKGENEE